MSPDQRLVLEAALAICRKEVMLKAEANGGWAGPNGGPCPLEIRAVNALQDLVRQVEREQHAAGEITDL